MIKFQCDNCGKNFSVPEDQAGKKGKCPKCKTLVVVPVSEDCSSVKGRSDSEASSAVSDIDSSLFDIPERSGTAEELVSQQDMPDKDDE